MYLLEMQHAFIQHAILKIYSCCWKLCWRAVSSRQDGNIRDAKILVAALIVMLP